jgi:hypothetical protein
MPKYKLRGEVTKRWKTAGCPQWNYDTTKNVCLEVDRYLAGLEQNPASRFREEIGKKNETYIGQWVRGCHFDWLNPRPITGVRQERR